MDNFKPLSNNVLIKPIKEENKTSGGLYLSDPTKTEAQTGIVMATGNGIRNDKGDLISLQVQVGDKVFFNKNTVTKVNDTFLVIKENNILGIVE
jgi:chaperonin GroES